MNDGNLIPQAHVLTVEEQSRGGVASGKARRQRRELRQALEELLSSDFTDQDGNDTDGAGAVALALFKKALDGDTRAFVVIRDTVEGKPTERITLNTDSTLLQEQAAFRELCEQLSLGQAEPSEHQPRRAGFHELREQMGLE